MILDWFDATLGLYDDDPDDPYAPDHWYESAGDCWPHDDIDEEPRDDS